jgi:hypothetical protein
MIAIENLKTILFFSFRIDQFSKISSLLFSFESDINFFSMHFLKCLLVFLFLVRKLIFDILGPEFRFRALKSYFCLFGPKSIFFLTPCKIPDRWIYHTTILILGPKFRFWALGAYLRPFDLQKYIFSYFM